MRYAVTAFGFALAFGVGACSVPHVTQVIVVVDTDLRMPAEIDHLEIDVTGPAGMHASAAQTLDGHQSLPFTLTVVPGEPLGPIDIVVGATLHGAQVVSRRGSVMPVAGESRVVLMHLVRSCVGTTCPNGQSCGEAGCVAIANTPLYSWGGTPPRLGADAGPALDGGHDAGHPPNDAALDTSLDFDAGPDCTTLGCDDMNPCTDDVCNGMRTCEHHPLDIACDDHMFCNGLDHCGSGTCSLHAGNPCIGSTTCDETADVCMGCTSDAECPAMMTGGFGACGGFSDACSNNGTQSRIVRTFHCTASACVPADTTDTQPCFRDTTGTSCAATSCSSFGVCDPGSAGTCALSGTASRTCNDYTCRGGSCQPTARLETAGCARGTDGTPCGADSCGAWGGCGGFSEPCGTTGTQSRDCNSPVCSGGGCGGGASRTETQGCSRGSTDGVGCGATYCDGWGACDFGGDPCALNGTQYRTCHDPVCRGGGCGTNDRTESQGCSRGSTDGAGCGATECGAQACTGGLADYQCDQDGYLEASCRDRICMGGGCGYSAYYTQNGAACTISTDGQSCFAGCGCDYCWSGSCVCGC